MNEDMLLLNMNAILVLDVDENTCIKPFTDTMGDDSFSASELRQRYHKGGSVPDSDLSASQLRGRYGIENTKGR